MNNTEKMELGELYDAYFKRVYNYISYRLNNHIDTEDLVSRVFLKVLEKYGSYDPSRAALSTWLIRIAHNTVADYFRERSRMPELSDDGLKLSGESSPDEIVIRREENRLLITALATLPERERQVIALKYGAELKSREIAAVTGLSEANVSVILFRSIRKLRSYFDKEELKCESKASAMKTTP